MTKFLTGLICDETPILRLEANPDISNEKKYEVLDLESSISNIYIKNMYYKDGAWYYYKQDKNDSCYPYYMADELMGTYLAKKRNLQTVTYEVASVDDTYGLASINFKKDNFKYYKVTQLIKGLIIFMSTENIDILKKYAIDSSNEKEFVNHIFNFLALDIHMLQKDRAAVNFQFQIDKNTGHFDLAPLYDYSNCSLNIGSDGIIVPNNMIKLTEDTIIDLIKNYKEFKECLELCLDQSMEKIWNEICLDYKLNQECNEYERIRQYYETKDDFQKYYIKEMITKAKKL